MESGGHSESAKSGGLGIMHTIEAGANSGPAKFLDKLGEETTLGKAVQVPQQMTGILSEMLGTKGTEASSGGGGHSSGAAKPHASH